MAPLYYRDAQAILVTFSLADLKSFEKLIIGHTTEISTIGLDQDDPRLIEYIRQSYLVHPKVEEVCKYC